MNEKQKEYLRHWVRTNCFTVEKESEWTPPLCVHSQDIEPLFEKLLKI